MPGEICEYHGLLMQDLGSIKADVKTLIANSDKINGRYEKHIDEGVGYRDKVNKLSVDVEKIKQEKLNTVKASQYRIALLCSAPGIIWVLLQIYEHLTK